jgi:hypothetical protein
MFATSSHSRYLACLIISICAQAIAAYTTFEPECTEPKEPVSFVSTPNSRGTLEILWSSLFTIFACTWTIQHPNVPEQRDGRFPGWKGDLRWGLRHAVESLKLAIATILAPEFVIYVARCELTVVRYVSRGLESFAKEDGVPWSRKHGHLAAMGGFIVRVKKAEGDDSEYVEPYHLTGEDLYYLRRNGHIRLPRLTEDDIADRSKSDPLLKTIAIGQIFWSIVQIITRAIRGLSISLLELSVLAFAACAIAVYILYWDKPKHINIAVTVQEYDDKIPDEIHDAFIATNHPIRNLLATKDAAERRMKRIKGRPIPTLAETTPADMTLNWEFLFLLGGTIVFGAIHVAGWNFSFPTSAEQTVWRCASVFTTVSGILVFLIDLLGIWFKSNSYLIIELAFSIVTGLYILARLYILVETFRSLAFLPIDAFESTWTGSIPHFS